jgi:sugar/nucleoside kinase (ribokinase family)
MVADGTRSMASDPGDLGWLAAVGPGPWLDGVDWLFVSGYALLRAPAPQHLVRIAAAAREQGTRVAVDLASAAMVARFGGDAFASLCRSLHPSVVFANESELAVAGNGFAESTVLVVKRGGAGACFLVDGVPDERAPVEGTVVDVTGAGDALAAGYLLGGPDLAMVAAGRCVARRGAQP